MVRVSCWSLNSSPAAQRLGQTVQDHLPEAYQRDHCFQICSLKNVPKTASTLYGWCPSVPEVHKSLRGGERIQEGSEKQQWHNLLFISVIFSLLLEPFLKFPFVPLPPHFLFGCCSPRRPHSNQTEMLEDKVNSESPSAPGLSPASQAE